VAQSALDSGYYLVNIANCYMKIFPDDQNNAYFADILAWLQVLKDIYMKIYCENQA